MSYCFCFSSGAFSFLGREIYFCKLCLFLPSAAVTLLQPHSCSRTPAAHSGSASDEPPEAGCSAVLFLNALLPEINPYRGYELGSYREATKKLPSEEKENAHLCVFLCVFEEVESGGGAAENGLEEQKREESSRRTRRTTRNLRGLLRMREATHQMC